MLQSSAPWLWFLYPRLLNFQGALLLRLWFHYVTHHPLSLTAVLCIFSFDFFLYSLQALELMIDLVWQNCWLEYIPLDWSLSLIRQNLGLVFDWGSFFYNLRFRGFLCRQWRSFPFFFVRARVMLIHLLNLAHNFLFLINIFLLLEFLLFSLPSFLKVNLWLELLLVLIFIRFPSFELILSDVLKHIARSLVNDFLSSGRVRALPLWILVGRLNAAILLGLLGEWSMLRYDFAFRVSDRGATTCLVPKFISLVELLPFKLIALIFLLLQQDLPLFFLSHLL